jgi:hypothetical protein
MTTFPSCKLFQNRTDKEHADEPNESSKNSCFSDNQSKFFELIKIE